MPELPEVETTRRGVAPHLCGQQVTQVAIREHRLRWPIPASLPQLLSGETITGVNRRGKYLLFSTAKGVMILHLGMSGCLRIMTAGAPAQKHDHVDIGLSNGMLLRFSDPRRFGSILWTDQDPLQHTLLAKLGPEPLSKDFNGQYLHSLAAGRTANVKSFIMNSHIVVGVGNIYANEALFSAGIHPKRSAGRISADRYIKLAEEIRQVLAAAIESGGTTLKDFLNSDGKPGYFSQALRVYGRAGQPCEQCGEPLKEIRIAQRSTVCCPHCQR